MPFDITTTPPRIGYVATSLQTAFTVPFGFFANGDLRVYQNGTLLTLTMHYTVTGAGVTGGGTVTLVTGATAGDAIVIERRTARSRTSAYTTGGALPAASLETDLDKLLCMLQELETNGVEESTFTVGTAGWTGFATGLNVTFAYRIFNGIVCIYSPTGTLTDTSNGTGLTIVAGQLPAAIRPRGERRLSFGVMVDNAINQMAGGVVYPDGSIIFTRMTDSAGTIQSTVWTGSGTKGIPSSRFWMMYPL